MSLYAYVNNDVIEDGPRLLPHVWRHISGLDRASPAELASWGWLPVRIENPPELNQIVSGSTYQITETEVIQTYILRDRTPDEITREEEVRADAVRRERNSHLTACDWTQQADAPLSDLARAAWAEYRQALRDVPNQPGFPFDVTWPVQPVAPYATTVPKSVTRYQGRAQLADTPLVIEGVETDALTVIESMMASQPRAARIAFEEATVWERNSPMVIEFATGFGWDSETLDAFFRAAAQRTA